MFSRKILLSTVLSILVLLLLTPLLFAEPQPNRGGTLNIALPAEPPGFNPTTDTSAVIDRVVYANIYEGLVQINRHGKIVPALAAKWEISPDQKTYTFYLQRGVTFHNGQPFTAEDVKFTMERNLNKQSLIIHPEYYSSIEKISVVDEYTIEIGLQRPNSMFLFNLARGDSIILPRGEDLNLKTHPIGTGPFKFQEWKRGTSVTLVRFENYSRKELPYLDKVTFHFIPDPSTQIAALKSGDVNVIAYGTSPENALSLENDPRFKVLNGVTTGEVILTMNNARKPFDNRLVREAICYAIDREEIIQGAMYGFGQPIGSLMTPTNPNYLDLTWLYPHEIDKAKQLLQKAGLGGGFKATIKLPKAYDYALRTGKIIADQLSEIGIELNIEKIGWGQWVERVFLNSEYELTVIGHVEAFDISIYADPGSYFNYDNMRFQEVISRAEVELDPERRNKLYSIAQWIIAEEVPSAFLFALPSLPAMRNNVQNWWKDYPLPAINVTEVWLQPE